MGLLDVDLGIFPYDSWPVLILDSYFTVDISCLAVPAISPSLSSKSIEISVFGGNLRWYWDGGKIVVSWVGKKDDMDNAIF